jgi:long-chain acyl-CoA synthetase
VTAWVNERVAPYKRLRELHTIDALPRTPSGKLLRRRLREPLAV